MFLLQLNNPLHILISDSPLVMWHFTESIIVIDLEIRDSLGILILINSSQAVPIMQISQAIFSYFLTIIILYLIFKTLFILLPFLSWRLLFFEPHIWVSFNTVHTFQFFLTAHLMFLFIVLAHWLYLKLFVRILSITSGKKHAIFLHLFLSCEIIIWEYIEAMSL